MRITAKDGGRNAGPGSRDLPAWFGRFMAPDADRPGELMRALDERGVKGHMLELAGGRFVLACPKGATSEAPYRVKLISAHHDRVPGTLGALDNSAACLQLVDFLAADIKACNTLVVFTDKEELGPECSGREYIGTLLQALDGDGARPGPRHKLLEQGSYGLGCLLRGGDADGQGRSWPLAGGQRPLEPLVFSLDVTGRGDTLLLSRSIMDLAQREDRGLAKSGASGAPAGQPGSASGPSALSAMAAQVEALAGLVARLMAGRGRLYRAALPLGEDLGFILAGVPALEISVLPRAEAEALVGVADLPAWAHPGAPGSRTPRTWSWLHGPDDRPSLYDADAFGLMATLLGRLGSLRVPAPAGQRPTARPS